MHKCIIIGQQALLPTNGSYCLYGQCLEAVFRLNDRANNVAQIGKLNDRV